MDFDDEDVKYLRYVKVALTPMQMVDLHQAMAIIRQKPKHLTAKEHAEQLAKAFKDKGEGLETKLQDLNAEVFLMKQKLVQAQLTAQANCTLARDSHPDHVKLDESSLTPPPSSHRNKDIPCLQKHAQFLRSVSFFCKQPTNLSAVLAGDQIDVVKETIIVIFKMLAQESGDELVSLPKTILQSCFSGIKDVLQSPCLENHQSDLEVPVLSLIEHLLLSIMEVNRTIPKANEHDTIAQLIVSIGCCQWLRNDTLSSLASCVFEFSKKLRDVTQGCGCFRDVVREYNSVYHVLWSIEHILVKTALRVPCPDNVKQQLTVVLEDSLLHISSTFPVFAIYVWRLQGLLR